MTEKQLKRGNRIKDEISMYESMKTHISSCDKIEFIGGESANRWSHGCYKKDSHNLYHYQNTAIAFDYFQKSLLTAIDEEIQRLNQEFEKL